MREIRPWGSVRGVSGNRYPYRDPSERRFRDDGTQTTRSYQPNDGDDRMDENDEDVVHGRHRIKTSKNLGIQADFVIRHGQVLLRSSETRRFGPVEVV